MPEVPEDDDTRCRGIYGSKYPDPDKRGERCEYDAKFNGYCSAHRDWGERRCVGHYTKNHPTMPGERCVEPAMKGQTVCFKHGGGTRANRQRAERRLAEQALASKVEKLLKINGVQPVRNPLSALAQLGGEVVALKDALAAKVEELEQIRYESKAGGEQVRAEVALYERALDRCNSVLGNIAKLNIDERLAKIEEARVAAIINAIEAGIAEASIPLEQANVLKKTVARHLRAV